MLILAISSSPGSLGSLGLGWARLVGLFVLHNSTDATALAKMGCYCDNGVFLGWGTWLPYAALASGVVYSWLTGKAKGRGYGRVKPGDWQSGELGLKTW